MEGGSGVQTLLCSHMYLLLQIILAYLLPPKQRQVPIGWQRSWNLKLLALGGRGRGGGVFSLCEVLLPTHKYCNTLIS